MEKFVVKHYSDDPHPTLKGNGFDGLTIGDYREQAEDFIKFVNELIDDNQKPAHCNCKEAKSGNE